MVFVKFHNMKQEKTFFLMSPLNSNNLKIFHFTTSQNNITITVQKCSVFFSSLFNLCTVYLLKKCSFFSFFLSFFFLYPVFNSVQVSFLFLSVLFPLSCTFFLFVFVFFFFSLFFIINCSKLSAANTMARHPFLI